jgi:flagellar motility protein MotE (MotC chaperone)
MIETLTLAASITSFASKAKLWGQKTWAWMKVNGHVVFLIATGLILFIVSRKSVDFSKILSERKTSYEDEIKVLKDSHEKEIQDRDEASRRYQEAIKQIEEKYESDSKKLEKKKKTEIKRLIENNPDNPEEITKKIAELTGFNIVDMS